jgi:hypothetical protein
MLEEGSIGIMGKTMKAFKPNIPLFHRSIIPELSFIWTLLLADVLLNLLWEIIQQARYGHRRSRGKSAIRFPCMLTHTTEYRDKLFSSFSSFNTPEQIPNKWESFSARSAPSARFSNKKFDEV